MHSLTRIAVTIVVLTSFCKASSKSGWKDEAQALFSSAADATDIQRDGAKPFRLVARIRLTFDKPLDGSYKLLWANRQEWREEIEFPGYKQVMVRNGDRQWRDRNLAYTPLRVLELAELLHPKLPAWPKDKERYSVRHLTEQVQNGLRMKCVALAEKFERHSTFCFDVTSGALVQRVDDPWEASPARIQEFIDYTSFDNKLYPRRQRLIQGKEVVVEAWVDDLAADSSAGSVFAGLQGIQPIPTCDNVQPPKPAYTPDPEYSDEARKRKIEGTAVIRVEVGSDGRVKNAVTIQSLTDSLDQQAMATVKRWKFHPAMCGSNPVPAEITVEITFRLR